ncbi:MAG: SPASM domain-containing protein [Salinivirgaceae bacterium]|nr:SPASM domain-containing protein [Salinivirgaceae bacterium]
MIGGAKTRLALRLLRAFTLRRILNSARLRVCSLVRRKVVRNMPESLSVEPASVCNLHCPECTLGNGRLQRPERLMDMKTFENVLVPLSPWLVSCQFFLQGEPTLNPNLCQMIASAHRRRIFTTVSTNGQTLTPELCSNLVSSGLDRLIVSVDGTTQEVYEKYRVGGSLQAAIDGIDNMVAARKALNRHNPLIEVQFIVFRHNERQISQIRQLTRQWGADRVVLKTAQIENPAHAAELLPQNPKYSRYRIDTNGKASIKRHYNSNCFRLRSTMVVTSNGDVAACCYDKNCQHNLGNVNQNHPAEIWLGEKANSLRHLVWKLKDGVEMCQNCGG